MKYVHVGMLKSKYNGLLLATSCTEIKVYTNSRVGTLSMLMFSYLIGRDSRPVCFLSLQSFQENGLGMWASWLKR